MNIKEIHALLSTQPTTIEFFALLSSPRETQVIIKRLTIDTSAVSSVGAVLRSSLLNRLKGVDHETKISDFGSHKSSDVAWKVKVSSKYAVGASKEIFTKKLGSGISSLLVDTKSLQGVNGLVVSFNYARKDSDGVVEIVKVRAYYQYYGGAILTKSKYLKIINSKTLTVPSEPIFRLPTSPILIGGAEAFYVIDMKKYESKFGFDDAVNKFVKSSLKAIRTQGILSDTTKILALTKTKNAYKQRVISAADLLVESGITLAEIIYMYDNNDISQKGMLTFDDVGNPKSLVVSTLGEAQNFIDYCNTDIVQNRIGGKKFRVLSKKGV